jgi:RNA recognition motif-containing protein
VNEDFGFVHYGTPEEADAACEGLNQTDILGSRVRVQKSTSQKRQGGASGGSERGGGCFKCGDSGHWSKECPHEDGGYERGSRSAYAPTADPYDNPLIERYRRTIDLLHERIRYLEDLLAARAVSSTSSASADPYARPAPDYYDRRATSSGYEDVAASAAAFGDSRSGGGKMSAYMSDSPPPYRSRPY